MPRPAADRCRYMFGMAVAVLLSCSVEGDEKVNDLRPRLLLEDERLSGLGRIVVADSLLVIVEPYSPQIHVASITTGRILRSAVREGGGPMEARRLVGVQFVTRTGYAWALDQRRLRMLRFVPDRLVSEGEAAVQFVDLARNPLPATVPIVLTDRIVSLTLEVPSSAVLRDRFVWLDLNGDSVGLLPDARSKPDGQNSLSGPSASLRPSQLVAGPNGLSFAQVGFIEERVRFLTMDGHFLKDVTGPNWSDAQATVGPSAVITTASRITYASGSAANDRLALLLSGQTMTEVGRNLPTGNELHLFEWEGEFLSAFKLEGEFSDIALSDDGTKVFLYRSVPTPAILVATVPRLSRK